jgi:tRNA C32,U32 (ribose-2'-O)-methylase TrmJ
MMVELIEDFFAENPAMSGEPDAIDTDEVITALAKTVADLTSSQSTTVRQQIIEALMREIMEYDEEFRREDASGAVTSAVRH